MPIVTCFCLICPGWILSGGYGSAKSETIVLEVSTAVDEGQVCISGNYD